MTDVNDGNFYLSRARCNRVTVLLEPQSTTKYIGTAQLNGKITQVVLDWSPSLPLQSGSGTGNFVINSDVTRPVGGVKVPYHVAINGFVTTGHPSNALKVMDVTPGSDIQGTGVYPVFYNTTGDGAGSPQLTTEGGNVALGKTSWNGLVAGQVEFSFELSGSSPVGREKAIVATIYLE